MGEYYTVELLDKTVNMFSLCWEPCRWRVLSLLAAIIIYCEQISLSWEFPEDKLGGMDNTVGPDCVSVSQSVQPQLNKPELAL